MWLPCWLHPQSPLLSSFALWSPSLQPTREVCGLSLYSSAYSPAACSAVCVSAAGLEHALQCLAQEDPSLRVSVDQDTGQVHIGHPYTVS